MQTPENGNAASLSVTYTSPDDLRPLMGSRTVGFQVIATASSDFFFSWGNGSGTSFTQAFPDLVLTYHYTPSIPEPSSILLVGLGVGGLLVYRSRRRSA